MIIHLNTLTEWESLIEASKEKPIIVLKNSIACAVCSAIRTMLQKAIRNGELFTPVHMVTIQEHPEISEQIEHDTAVQHETPQVIVIRSGHPVYHRNHYDITIQDIKDSIERNT